MAIISSTIGVITEPSEPRGDDTAPSITITEPLAGVQVTAPTVTVKGTAADPAPDISEVSSGVRAVEYRRPDGAYADATNTGTRFSTWSAAVPVPDFVASGQAAYAIAVRARDGAGHVTDATTTVTLRDVTRPAVAVTAPGSGYVITDTSFAVEGTATDVAPGMIQSGVRSVEVLVDGVKAADAVLTPDGAGVRWSATVSVPAALPATGQHTIVARATDGGGLTADTSVVVPTRDNTPPTLDVLAPPQGAQLIGDASGVTVTFTGVVTDTLGGKKRSAGMRKVECRLGAVVTPAQLVAAPNGAFTWSAPVRLPSLGTHTVTIYWEDVAGNHDQRDLTLAVARQSKGDMTPSAYLADLIDYATRTVRRDAAGGAIDRKLLTGAFLQPFDVTPDPAHVLRVAIEVLRRFRAVRPAACWPLNDGAGATAADTGAGSYAGTLQPATGGPTWVAAGRVGGALAFDGVNDLVTIGGDAALRAITDNFTLAFWANPTATHTVDAESTTGTAGIAGKRYAIGPEQGTAAYGAPLHAGVGVSVGTNGVSVYEHSDFYLPAVLVHQATLAGWTHVAVVYQDRQPTLYLNGVKARTGLKGPMAAVHARPASLGGHGYGYFTGQLDEVRVYDRALTPAMVAAIAGSAGAELAAAEAPGESAYRFAAYQMLLKQIGTSFEEVRLARSAGDAARRAVADRLGVALGARPDILDDLYVEPAAVTEARLEELFGLRATTRNPLDVLPDAKLLARRVERQVADWQAADQALPTPVVDPDLIGVADMVSAKPGNRAYDLWSERRTWVQTELSRLRKLRTDQATAVGGMTALLTDVWGATAPADLDAMATDRAAGTSIQARLDARLLDLAAFLFVQRIRALAASSTTVVSSEWEEVYAVLLQVNKRRQFAAWKEKERQRNLTLDGTYFTIPDALTDQGVALPPWRATPLARQQWQDVLGSRMDQRASLEEALGSAVDATEEAALPMLRDALVAAIGVSLGAAPDDLTLPDRLTRRLLLDVRDSGYRRTTRVEQAIATLQEVLFSLRAGRSKEPDALLGRHPASFWALARTEEQFDREWRWMGSYETWRAATFIYHFPENLLLPTLRDPAEMSPAFVDFLTAVRGQSRLTPAGARAVATAYLDALRGQGLAAHWPFDEGTGTTAADASQHGNAATFGAGTPPVWGAGHDARGLAFDGNGGLVVPHSASLDLGRGGGDFAVTFWLFLRVGPTNAFRSLLHKGAVDMERSPAIFLQPNGNRLHFRLSTEANPNEGGDSVAEIPLQTWTHVAYVKTGSELRLYINGALDQTVTLTGPAKGNTGSLYIGKDPWFAGTNAILDDVRVYNPPFFGLARVPATTGVYDASVVTDQLTDDGFTRRRALSAQLLAPWVDGSASALRPDTPPFLKEVLYFVPMQLALQLHRAGQHLAALDWFQTVYAYNLPIAQRKIYTALEAERALPSVYAATSDVWLATGLNPHAVAARRANAYTRFTVMSLTRCFTDFADAEFTRDTGESLPRARALYMTALELLDLPEMQPTVVGEGAGAVTLVNPALVALRAHAEVNLLKLRQGRNIAGMQRPSEPPAAAPPVALPGVGSGGQVVLARPTALRPTPYYYAVLVDRAKHLVSIAQQVEAAYLAALEKRDAEAYSLLRARQDAGLTQATVDLQGLRVTEAERGVTLADRQTGRARIQADTYDTWLATPVSELEQSVLDAYRDVNAARNNLAAAEYLITSGQAMITAATATVGAGAAFAAAMGTIAGAFVRAGLQTDLNNAESRAQVNAMLASQERRRQEWELQRALATQDVLVGTQQVLVAQAHQQVAEKEKAIAQMQADNARVVVDFLANKFTSAELYEWMSGVLGTVYSYFLQQATATAQLAADQLAFERQEPPPAFIQSDYWQAPSEAGQGGGGAAAPDRRGLTGSARLLQDIYQLDQFAFQTNRRKLQLSQTFSVASLAPHELQRFRETGRLLFETSMELFDRAFPGHYLRLVRRVRTSVVALVPPVQGIRATLVSSGISKVVIGGDAFQTVTVRRDPEVVALTSPANAGGTFELDIQSDMLLPFEGTGVATRWELLLPRAANGFDYRSIADVLFTIDYTALNSFDLREQVIRSLPRTQSADRPISVRRQFPDQWYALRNPAQAERPMRVRFSLGRGDFPPNLDALRVEHLLVHFARAAGSSAEVTVADFRTPATPSGTARPAVSVDGTISTRRTGGASWAPLIGRTPVGDWELVLPDDEATRGLFSGGAIEDVLLVVTYGGQLPAWV